MNYIEEMKSTQLNEEEGVGYPVKISQYWGDVPLAHKNKKVIPYFLDIFLPFFPIKINIA